MHYCKILTVEKLMSNFENCSYLGKIFICDSINCDDRYLPTIINLSRVYLYDRELDRKCRKSNKNKKTETIDSTLYEDQLQIVSTPSEEPTTNDSERSSEDGENLESSEKYVNLKIAQTSVAYLVQQLASVTVHEKSGDTGISSSPVIPSSEQSTSSFTHHDADVADELFTQSSDDTEEEEEPSTESSDETAADEEAKLCIALGLPAFFGRNDSPSTKKHRRKKFRLKEVNGKFISIGVDQNVVTDQLNRSDVDAAVEHTQVVENCICEYTSYWITNQAPIIWRAWLCAEVSNRLPANRKSPKSFLALCPTAEFEELSELIKQVEEIVLIASADLYEMSMEECNEEWCLVRYREARRTLIWWMEDALKTYWSSCNPDYNLDSDWSAKRSRDDIESCLSVTGFKCSLDGGCRSFTPTLAFYQLTDSAISDSYRLHLLPTQDSNHNGNDCEMNTGVSEVAQTFETPLGLEAEEGISESHLESISKTTPGSVDDVITMHPSSEAGGNDPDDEDDELIVGANDTLSLDCITRDPALKKYWKQRYRLFGRFDDGILLDRESWFSVTSQVIAEHHALRCQCDIIVDAFCGAGGNAIRFAETCNTVIAIDIDPQKIELARHNAQVYGVDSKIEFICGDFFQLADSGSLRGDVVFLSPPWGGPSYLNESVFDLDEVIDMRRLIVTAKRISNSIGLFLPRNVNNGQLPAWVGHGEVVEVEQNLVNDKVKTITAYLGQLLYSEEPYCEAQ